MRKQDQLSTLINSLSNNEKRYFKLQASMHSGDKTFTHLFDEMAMSSTYEPNELSKKLNITKPHLTHIKNYLEKSLLGSLRLYDQNNNIEAGLIHQWQVAKLLYQRGQHEMALSITEKTLEKALEYENFSLALNLVKLKYSLSISKVKYEESVKAEKLRNLIVAQANEIEQIFNMITRFNKVIMSGGKNKYLQKPAPHPLFNREPAKLKSDSARVRWHEMKQSYYFYGKEDTKMSIHYTHCALRIFQARPKLIYTMSHSYLSSMLHLCIAYNQLGNYEEALKTAHKIEIETDGHRNDIPLKTCSEFNTGARMQQAMYLCPLGRYEEAVKRFSKIENELGRLNRGNFIMAKYYHALALFYTGRLDKALKVGEYLYNSPPELNLGLILYSRMLLIMIHHALKNYSLLPNLTTWAFAWTQKHEIDWPGTGELIGWFKKFEKAVASGTEKKFFVDFSKAIQKKSLKGHVIDLDLKRWANMNLNKHK